MKVERYYTIIGNIVLFWGNNATDAFGARPIYQQPHLCYLTFRNRGEQRAIFLNLNEHNYTYLPPSQFLDTVGNILLGGKMVRSEVLEGIGEAVLKSLRR